MRSIRTSRRSPRLARSKRKENGAMATAEKNFYGTGRRKESTARVWIKNGSGTMMVNGRTLDEYFGRETSKMIIHQPLQLLEQVGKMDITVNVTGGGLSGQAGAIRHGLSR